MKAINYFREKNISWYHLIDNYNATLSLPSPVYLIYEILLLCIGKHFMWPLGILKYILYRPAYSLLILIDENDIRYRF